MVKNNGMKANADKCYLIVNWKEKVCAGRCDIQSSEQKKLLGVLNDNKSTFGKHINNICAKASQKLNALYRMSLFINTTKKLWVPL